MSTAEGYLEYRGGYLVPWGYHEYLGGVQYCGGTQITKDSLMSFDNVK